MRILVYGGRDFGKLPKTSPPHMLSPGIYSFGDRKHPDWPKKWAESVFVKQTLEELAIKHSKHYVPNDNWLPSDIEIISGGATGGG